jgi:hypothetical protein
MKSLNRRSTNGKHNATTSTKPATAFERAMANADARMRRLLRAVFHEGVVVGVDVERGFLDAASFPGLGATVGTNGLSR